MSITAELMQVLYDLPLTRKPGRDEVAHFCEHDGIKLRFTRARTTWQALTPLAVRPWWIILNPIKHKMHSTDTQDKYSHNNKIDIEVHDNA